MKKIKVINKMFFYMISNEYCKQRFWNWSIGNSVVGDSIVKFFGDKSFKISKWKNK